jgi:hypothetical protein
LTNEGSQIPSEWKDSILPRLKQFMEGDRYNESEIRQRFQEIQIALSKGNQEEAKRLVREICSMNFFFSFFLIEGIVGSSHTDFTILWFSALYLFAISKCESLETILCLITFKLMNESF